MKIVEDLILVWLLSFSYPEYAKCYPNWIYTDRNEDEEIIQVKNEWNGVDQLQI